MFKKYLPLFLVLVSLAGMIFFRFYHRSLPYTYLAAKQEIYEAEKKSVIDLVKKKYPNAGVLTIDKVAQEWYKEKSRFSKAEIDYKIYKRSQELKDRFFSENGRIYLMGLDSYYWLRLTRNLIDKGHIGDRSEKGVEYDDLIGAPIDSATKKNIHVWLGFIFYKIAVLFNKNVDLANVVFYVWVPLFICLGVFSFYVAMALGANGLGAFFASLIIYLSPFLLSRQVGEWFDTDIYNVLFPILVFWIFLYAFREKSNIRRIFLLVLSALFLGFYAATWQGWWFIFDLIIVSALFFIFNQKLSEEETTVTDYVIKSNLTTTGLFFIFSGISVIFICGIDTWKNFIIEPLRLASILKITSNTLWPNVYLTVAELGAAAPSQIVSSLGGGLIFFTALIGTVCIFLFYGGSRDSRIGFGLWCLVFWILFAFYSSLEALRFMLLLVVPIGLAFGLSISKIYELLDEFLHKYCRKKIAFISRYIVVGVFSVLFIFSVFDNCSKSMAIAPQMNDYWYNTLIKIKKDTPKDAIINSWWDFGHWFKAIAERRVLADGMTQNTPYVFWTAAMLLTDNEKEAIGILRMIDTTGNKAADFLEKKVGLNLESAVNMIKKALAMEKEEAVVYLNKQLSKKDAQELLNYLFPEKSLPPAYFIVSYDMPVKIGPISYIGNWDFKRVDMYFKAKRVSKREFLDYAIKTYVYTKEGAEEKYLEILLLNEKESRNWFSKMMYYASSFTPAEQVGKLLFFENGLVVNTEDNSSYVLRNPEQGRGMPKSLFVIEKGELKEYPQKDSKLDFSALLIKEKETYKSILLNKDLAKSMLVRLYFLKGEGLKFFKLFHKEEDENGNAIYVYEVKWQELLNPKSETLNSKQTQKI